MNSTHFLVLAASFVSTLFSAFNAVYVHAEGIVVASAASNRTLLQDIVPVFESDTGIKVEIVIGSSGSLAHRLVNGAPYDVFLSADRGFVDHALTKQESPGLVLPYARGELVLFSLNPEFDCGSFLDSGIQVPDQTSRLALANPDHAPYGRSAREYLMHQGVWDLWQGRLVMAGNVAEAAQYVVRSAVDAALVSRSLINGGELARLVNENGCLMAVDGSSYTAPEHWLLVPQHDNESALAFARYLTGDDVRGVLKNFGFGLPALH